MEELEALARISEAVSESLYLEESLEAIVKTTMEAVDATGAALVLEDGEIAWPEGRAGAYAVRLPLRWKRRQIGELVCDRDSPFTDEERQLLASIAHHAAVALEHGRAVMRGVLAQEIHHRVKALCRPWRLCSGSRLGVRTVSTPQALDDSVDRILAIAGVHEVLTERRDDVVDLSELLDAFGPCSSRGLRRGERWRPTSSRTSRSRATGDRAGPRLQRLFQNALEHGVVASGSSWAGERRGRAGHRRRRWGGERGAQQGTGLSIVRALVRDDQGNLTLSSDDGLGAEVVFPA